ncbi:MAG: hypothetical protein GKR94_20785 [Gammaproteobacteria bacterium]|nr:hypothetical protein [Gammaproteobacteria bacterium]
MFFAIALTVHVLAAVIWVGGMFFAYVCLRPAAAGVLEPPPRLTLWSQVFSRFFPWVWGCVAVLLVSGFWMIFVYFGGMKQAGAYVHIMMTVGIVMMFIFMYVFFAPYQRLKRAVAAGDWPAGGKSLNQIRILVGTNTALGLLTVAVAAGGRYLGF